MEAVIFVGIQASGKSTFYKERFFDTHVRLNLDMLRTRHREKLLLRACLEGKQPFVLFHDLRTIPPGKVLTVWLVSSDGAWARAATFNPDGRDIQVVQITMEVAGFDRCAVSLDDSAWGKHGTVVMESRIAPPPTTTP